jgi:hypothetical protein
VPYRGVFKVVENKNRVAATKSINILHSPSNVNFVIEIGLGDNKIVNILDEPFDEQTSHFYPALRKLMPNIQ